MKLQEISRSLGLKQLDGNHASLDKEVNGCYIGDLLSNVMSHAQADDLWLTAQTHSNIVAVAVLLNLAGIVIVEGHQPQADTLERARSEGVPLFSWPDSAYRLAHNLALQGIGSEES